jgi:hypothetical protein
MHTFVVLIVLVNVCARKHMFPVLQIKSRSRHVMLDMGTSEQLVASGLVCPSFAADPGRVMAPRSSRNRCRKTTCYDHVKAPGHCARGYQFDRFRLYRKINIANRNNPKMIR